MKNVHHNLDYCEMFIDNDFYGYALLNNIHALGYRWRWIVIYISADFHQM